MNDDHHSVMTSSHNNNPLPTRPSGSSMLFFNHEDLYRVLSDYNLNNNGYHLHNLSHNDSSRNLNS